MTKKYIYLQKLFTPAQLDTIQALAPDYQLVTSDAQQAIQPAAIEIMFGWQKELGAQLLHLPNSQLKWIQSISAGVDAINLSALEEKNILLSNNTGIHSVSISEHVLGTLLAEFRGLRTAFYQQEQSLWSTTQITYRQLSGQKMLIVGTGHIGKQLARSAKGLGVQPYGINTTGHTTHDFIECYALKNMHKIISEMDIVVNILPLTEMTYALYNQPMFDAMKDGVVFVNVGRGASVDTNALRQALTSGKISFASLDVFETEPLPKNDPLWTYPNVLITPHISGLTPHFREKALTIFTKNLQQFLKDGTLAENQVSLKKGY